MTRTQKKQEINTLEAYKIATNIINQKCDGATIYEANGIYKHDNGTVIFEKTLRIELMFIEKRDVLEIIKALKVAFNQESIVLQEQKIESELL